MARRFVIVGDGAAGLAAARQLRLRSLNASIQLVADDPHPAYYRAALTNYLLGELRDDQLWAVPPSFFTDYRVERRHARATALDVAGKEIWLHDGTSLPYDAALIACGARARPPSFAGAELVGVTTLRTLRDAQAIIEAAVVRRIEQAVVVGGGALGVELATALTERKCRTTLLVRERRVLDNVLDAEASDLVVARLRHLGVDVRTEQEVVRAEGEGGAVTAAVTKTGDRFSCQLLGVAIGVVPNTEWLPSKIALERELVVVDENLKTSAPDVWAAGDVAKPPQGVLQLWEPAQRQGRSAAETMSGRVDPYRPGAHYFATRLGDLDFASVGSTDDAAADEVLVERQSQRPGAVAYRKLWLSGPRVIGALMVGDRRERIRARGRILKRIIDAQLDVQSIKNSLFDPHFDAAAFVAQSRLLIDRPPQAPQPRPLAIVRGTQTIALAPLAPSPERVAPVPSTEQLSIGFRAPAEAAAALEGVAGYFESGAQRHPIERRTTVLGRSPLCDIVLDDAWISSRHASVTQQGSTLYLRDLGSHHGTWVNEALVTTPQALRHGDRVRLGSTLLAFRAADHVESPAAAASLTPASRSAYLQGVGGAFLGLSFRLDASGQTTVGRDASAQVRLDDISVSRRHALISGMGGRWTVCDLHSSRGTTKNGKLLEPGRDEPLANHDELRLGDVAFRFVAH